MENKEYLIEKIKKYFRKPKYRKTPDPLRLFVLSDLHWLSEEERKIIRNIRNYHPDLVLMLGDICRDDALAIVSGAGENIPVLSVLGNHDTWGQLRDIPEIIDLDGAIYRYQNTMFAGMSGSSRYKHGDYCMRTQEEAERIMETLPKADVLISHDGAYHLMSPNSAHKGFLGITAYIHRHQPSLSVFGHQHEPYEGFVGKTKAVCVFRAAIINTGTGAVEILF